MTPATLRKLEWASRDGGYSLRFCHACRRAEQAGHAPDCELDAAIREAEQAEQAEQAEKGERPEIRVGDIVVEAGQPYAVRNQRDADLCQRYARVIDAIYRDPLWRQEPPTHD